MFEDRLAYDEESPTGLVWTKTSHNKSYVQGRPAGAYLRQVNGKPNGIIVKVNDVPYRANRIIWVLCKGEIPEGYYIDHLDGNPWNNKLSNLVAKSPRANTQNLGLATNNQTGFKGVCLYTRKNGFTHAIAIVVDKNLKKIYKSYSVAKYGEEQALRLANEWRTAKLKDFNEQWADYTDRHLHG